MADMDQMNERTDQHRGAILGGLLIAILALLLIVAWSLGLNSQRAAGHGADTVVMGTFLIALGLMFFGSYLRPASSFFLRWLLHLSMSFPFFRSSKMAIFLSGLCILVGMLTIAKGLELRFF